MRFQMMQQNGPITIMMELETIAMYSHLMEQNGLTMMAMVLVIMLILMMTMMALQIQSMLMIFEMQLLFLV